jgi:L-Ala-D/L-Glu epimerase
VIRSAEVIPYSLPFRGPYVTARGRLDRRELLLLRITDSDGFEGLGETTSLTLRGGRGLEAIARELREVDWASPQAGDLSPEARCAIATALWDLELKRSGATVAPDPLPVNATLSEGPPGAVAEVALRRREEGFETFKLKVGSGEDVEQVRAVREALGDGTRIRVDANGAWTTEGARQHLAALAELGIELCEQPVGTLEAMAELRSGTPIPLAADESVAAADEAARARELGACDLVTVKLAKVGGPEVAAEDWGLPVYVSSALEGPVGIAAAARAAERLPRPAGIAHGLATLGLFSETIAARGPEVRDGLLHVPAGPGLGVEIDSDALARRRL